MAAVLQVPCGLLVHQLPAVSFHGLFRHHQLCMSLKLIIAALVHEALSCGFLTTPS
jgi:hypothetical protein